MPTSDSEDFESADEGSNLDKKERKQRLSSSNYSDNILDSEQDIKKIPAVSASKEKSKNNAETTDGWDDFDIEENEPIGAKPTSVELDKSIQVPNSSAMLEPLEVKKESQDTGWDDFGDWGEETQVEKPEAPKTQPTKPDPDIKDVTDRLAATSTNTSSGWGWGWGVDSLLSTASAGFSTLTSQVSQGISTVLESGIGAPDPEELARKSKEAKQSPPEDIPSKLEGMEPEKEQSRNNSDAAFPFGSIFSGVTKFVETTGTKVISGGLDTLETIGKKTMEVLQDGDPGLAKKRAMFGLDNDKPVLSQVLREAKAKAEVEDKVKEERREAKEVHYENLFDDFEGLVHLEALEMLSRQVNMRIQERLQAAEPDKRQDIKETLQQVAELCEMPEEEDEDDDTLEGMSKTEAFLERLQTATQDLGLKLQFQPLIKQYTETLDWLSTSELTEKALYKRAVSSLAQSTALSVELYHKAAEMLLVKTRRSTADEADALTQMTVVLTKYISEIATLFTEKLNSLDVDNKDQINTYITNIFLEAGNSSTYVQNAFQLALPILQIGAV